MVEIWKDVKGYEGHYKVSNTGKVYSCKRNRELRPSAAQKYYIIGLHKNGIRKFYTVHRLVAKTFIPNPDNKPEVNHIDQNPRNNNASNLEWVTQGENINSYYNSNKSKNAVKKRTETMKAKRKDKKQ